jgi:hypothetical protein
MEFLHHLLPDLSALYFSFSSFLEMQLDAVDDFLDQIDTNGPLLAGFFQAVKDFKAIESFSPPILLHDQWKGILCPLTGSKSLMAAETLPPSPNGVLILSQSGIDHFTLGMITKRTFHKASPPISSLRLKVSRFGSHILSSSSNFKLVTLNLKLFIFFFG